MRIFIGALALPLALLGSPALSENWRVVTKVGEVFGYIDTDSIKRDGDKVRFWMELRLPQAQAAPTGHRFDRMGSMIEIHCRAKTYRSLRIRANLGDQLIHEDKSPDKSASPVRPGTAADDEMRAVCSGDWASGG